MEKKKKKKLKVWSFIRDRWRLWLFEVPLLGLNACLFLDALCASLLPSGIVTCFINPASEFVDTFGPYTDPHSYFVFWGCAVISILFFIICLVSISIPDVLVTEIVHTTIRDTTRSRIIRGERSP